MSIQDRTHEFKSCVDSIRSRTAIGNRASEAKQRLLQANTKSGAKGEFSRMASSIGKDISATTIKLNKLGQLAKRKTLFDDRPVEISELTFIIKQDIANINKQIAALQTYVKQRHGSSTTPEAKMIDEHNNNIVMMLQGKLATTSMTFKDVLELRTQACLDACGIFSRTYFSAANQAPSLLYNPQRNDPMGDGSSNPYDQKGKGRAPQNGDVLSLDLNSAEEGGGSSRNGFMQMQLVEQQDSYIQQRSTAIESIETTIAELGQIFTQLANMVAEQRETVQRIDADTHDIMSNVSGAQRELLKYYASISSNRWLMLKIFGVLIVFFLVFILVS
ncbi:Integral membrane protein sed5 [Psilocybe cubensis]|uniref:Integral membrane protein sed5 n=2 Tax=Psilocybe cubensis TaxID=181762 RepID=A0ACB8HFD3_PSICU|nr:Integral membrane protein sed5 [Psilocybe cubensis]KAH9486556.1 Integral membrane protein sed5 [Psilocybe cubensis]